MARTYQIPPEVLEVLKESTIKGNHLSLPDKQYPFYTKIKKTIEALGGKWDKKLKTHVFPSDPREIIGLTVDKGSIKIEDSEQKKLQSFYTPESLALKLARMALLVEGITVLEPSAGGGALAMAAASMGAEVTCFDIDSYAVQALRGKGFKAEYADFLTIPSELSKFDVVLMNPPFSSNQDIKHVEHALNFVAARGSLIAIMQANHTERFEALNVKAKNGAVFRMDRLEELPKGTFKESGTMVATRIIRLQRIS